MTFDEARVRNPGLGFTLYAIDPLGPVTLEIITADGDIFTLVADSADAVLALAFPTPAPENAFD